MHLESDLCGAHCMVSSAGREAQNSAGLHSNFSRGVSLLAFHSRGQLLESASQTPVACGQHSMLS